MSRDTLRTLAARARMVIHCPTDVVFDAFADPDVTTRFWFSRADGRLGPGVRTHWYWDQAGVSTAVDVLEYDRPHRLRVDWSDPDDTSTVTWTFTALAPDRTLVEVVDTGFSGDAAAIVARALDSTGGFHLVLAGAKAWLEHGLALELVRDSLPQADCGDGDEH